MDEWANPDPGAFVLLSALQLGFLSLPQYLNSILVLMLEMGTKQPGGRQLSQEVWWVVTKALHLTRLEYTRV